jgi:hypothetical protein
MRRFNISATDLPRFSTWDEKAKNDLQLQKDRMDRMDLWYGTHRDTDENKKFNINYELFNGRLDTSLYEDPIAFNIAGESVKLGHQVIHHYPVTSQVAHAMWGEMINRPFRPTAKHVGASAQNLRRKAWNEQIRELLNARAIQPMREQITKSYLQQLQVADPRTLTPEQIQQVQADVARRVQEKTPKEVLDFMENDFQTPTEKQAQQLLEHLLQSMNIKYLQDEGFKHAIITGREVYYIGDAHGEPVLELLNPKYFTCSGSSETEWFHEMDWGKYERWLSFEAAVQKYAEHLKKDDYETLERYAEPIGGFADAHAYRNDSNFQRVQYEISTNGESYERRYGKVDTRTKEGQRKLTSIYEDVINKYGNTYGNSFSAYGVREVRFAWKDKRKLMRVERIENDKKVHYWLDEHYEPTGRDVSVHEVWIDEVWEGVKLGTTGDCLYLNVAPVPAQFKSIFNPFDVDLPFYGRNYETHMNNTRSVAPIDTAKPWQLEFDTTMAQIKHDMATDIGKVFVVFMNMKPDNIKWQDWLNTMKDSKLLIAASNKHGMSPIDAQMLRSVDLGRTSEIASKIQLLEVFRTQLLRSMYFNEARIGTIGQYANATNVQQNQGASYNQTEGFFETHRLIVEKMLNGLMNRAKHVYRERPEKLAVIMDDVSAVDLEMAANFWYEELGVHFSTSTEDIQRVNELRAQTMAFIQNGMSFDGILELAMARTATDITSIFRKETKRIQQQQAEAQQIAAQQAEQERLMKLEEVKVKEEGLNQRKAMDLEIKKLQATLGIEQFRAQADADQDGKADVLEKAQMQIDATRELENRRADQRDRELDIMEMKAKAGK